MILREGFKVAAIGSAIGFVLALPLPILFNSMFQGMLNFAAPFHLSHRARRHAGGDLRRNSRPSAAGNAGESDRRIAQ